MTRREWNKPDGHGVIGKEIAERLNAGEPSSGMTDAEKIRESIEDANCFELASGYPLCKETGDDPCDACRLARGLLAAMKEIGCCCGDPECDPDNPQVIAIANAMGLK